MNTLTRLAIAAALVAAPLAACTQQEADNAADTAENAGAEVADTAGDAADATRDAAVNVADETRDTVDDATTTTTEETTVRAGDDGLEVQNTETQR